MIIIDWLIANIGTILVGLAVLVVVVSIIVYKVLDKKQGKSSCGCGCAECPMSGKCHPTDSTQK